MSNQDDFDTELDVDQSQVAAPRREEPVDADDAVAEEDAATEDTMDAAPAKKRGSDLMFKAIVGVVAAGALGFYFMKSHGNAPVPAPQPPQQQAAAPAAPAPEAQPVAKPNEVVAAPAAPQAQQPAPSSDLDMLPAPVTPKDNNAAAAQTSGGDDPLAWGDAPATKGAAQQAEATAAPAMPAPAAPAAPAAAPAADMNAAPAPAAPQAQVIPDSAAPAQPATMEIPAPAAAKEPAKQESVAVPAAAPAPADKEKIDGIDQRLASIEETLNALQGKIATKDDMNALQERVAKLEQQPAAQKPAAEKPAAVKHAAPKKAKHAPTVKKHAPAKSAAGPAWVLRSAKPGTAWVAPTGSNELKSVSVGDTLTGIGRITTIDKDSLGRWVVVGTAGRITQ